jgi:hypothetical protein
VPQAYCYEQIGKGNDILASVGVFAMNLYGSTAETQRGKNAGLGHVGTNEVAHIYLIAESISIFDGRP